MRSFIVLMLLAFGAEATQIHKCTDADGTVVYSQTPCADDAEKVTVDIRDTGLGGGEEYTRYQAATPDDIRAYMQANADARALNNRIASLQRKKATCRLAPPGTTYLNQQAAAIDYQTQRICEMDIDAQIRELRRPDN